VDSPSDPRAGDRRQEDRLAALRLRMAIGRALEERGIAGPAAIGAALRRNLTSLAKCKTREALNFTVS
jgi:hypothetical protein